MGLEDIDEGDSTVKVNPSTRQQHIPSCATNNYNGNSVRTVDLADLFNDLAPQGTSSVSSSVNTVTNTRRGINGTQTHPPPTSVNNDPLDAFFCAPAQTPLGVVHPVGDVDKVPSKDLFDFSKPAERVRFSDERSFLEAFENQGKIPRGNFSRDGPSLADLSKGSSNETVKARLLHIMNYYDILGVTREASVEEIRQVYKRKALKMHPDRVGPNQTPEEAELFKVMTKAHEVLSDSDERAKYDAELSRGRMGGGDDANWFHHLRTP